MRGRSLCALAIVVGVLSLLATACGRGSEATGDGSSTSSAGGGSAEYPLPHRSKEVAEYGKEGSNAERLAANLVVAKNLKAREEADFVAQCTTLNAQTIAALPGLKKPSDCAGALRKFAEPLAKSKAARKDKLSGSISALRVGGKIGYALFHGTDGKNYAILLEKEDGNWKVASLLTFQI